MNIGAHFYFMSHAPEIIAAHGHVAFHVCIYLAWAANTESGACYPSLATIARNTGYSLKSIKKALPRLKHGKLLDWSAKDGSSNRYTFPTIKDNTQRQNNHRPIPSVKRHNRITREEVCEIVSERGLPGDYVDRIMRELTDFNWCSRETHAPIKDARAYVVKFIIPFMIWFDKQDPNTDPSGYFNRQ